METELMEERIKEYEEEIGKRPFDDPIRKELVEQHSIMRKALDSAIRTETERLDSYRQYDLNEDKIRIEEEKIKVEKAKSTKDLIGKIAVAGLSFASGFVGLKWMYDFENFNNSIPYRAVTAVLNLFKPKN